MCRWSEERRRSYERNQGLVPGERAIRHSPIRQTLQCRGSRLGTHPIRFDHPTRVFRTAITIVDDNPLAALIPIDCVLDEVLVSAAVGGTTAVETSPQEASDITGFPEDAISPIGTKQHLPTLVDVTALDFKTVYISVANMASRSNCHQLIC